MSKKLYSNRYRYFTPLVEHYLRMGVRHSQGHSKVASLWIDVTQHWLALQPDETRNIVKKVFSPEYETTQEGLANVLSEMSKADRDTLLNEIETDFAIFTGLIGGGEHYDRRAKRKS